MNIYDGLNPAQTQAVAHTDGPLLIMAGAGSGKTKVLTCKIAALLEKGISPYNILAITFTNKAATEMRQRVDNMIGEKAKYVWLSTFHSFCARFLRFEIEALGIYKKNFVIYDTADAQTLIKNCLKELNLDEKQYASYAVQSTISNAKNMMLSPEEFARDAGDFFARKVAEIYDVYQQHLLENNALDFDDLLMLAVKVLKEHSDIREKYQDRFQYILVDEYQDTNGAQYQLTTLLAGKYRNLCVVGDADQSIYGWRGADIRNIMDFEKDYPEAAVIKLEQNYRSTKTILNAANSVIEHNIDRKPKELWTNNPQGEKIIHYTASDERDEADFITREAVKQKTLFNASYGDMAVLYRTNAQSRALEEGFMHAGVPYTMVGGLKFYDRKEIKDILAYLRLIYNPEDTVSLMRIINVPKRSLGAVTMNKLAEFADMYNMNLFDAVSAPETAPITPKAKHALTAFAEFIMEMSNLSMQISVHELIEKVMEKSGYVAELEKENKIENQTRLENMQEFLSVAKNFEATSEEPTLENFLSTVSLVSDIDNADIEGDSVTLMTMHSAKGLEFPIVFLAGMEEGLFPHARTLMNEAEIEEERRTCYVGITRAERKLYITNAQRRMIFGRGVSYEPSRFISEIPVQYLEEKEAKRSMSFSDGFKGHYGSYKSTNSNYSTGGIFGKTAPLSINDRAKAVKPAGNAVRPDLSVKWKVGDKAKHAKWGIGTIVSVKGSGEEVELKIAFPGEGIKALMQKYAPITKA
ncbi:MAG TPA: DNA helicase PcrA [Candidatus Megamonas gallistercoris]|nr:DNA helicase PcrA [Candidatus Megamonas gallistercoris]